MSRQLMQLRDLFAMQAHAGWCHVLLSRLRDRLGERVPAVTGAIDRQLDRMDRRTQTLSMRFDAAHGTETFRRQEVQVREQPGAETTWGYSAINQDFFREIFRAIPVSLEPFAFVDVGSGKGAAVLMADEFPFRRLIGVELTAELVEVARRNVEKFNASAGRKIDPEWVHCDFFKWPLPNEPVLLFFNNPFPAALTLQAIESLERAASAHPHPVLLVFRKAPSLAGKHLHRSAFWNPLRLAPYWRVYSANNAG